jgi:hypothetical protein
MGNVAGQQLDQAVEEGKRDVADIKAAGAEKLEQVKETGAKAVSSAKVRASMLVFRFSVTDYN